MEKLIVFVFQILALVPVYLLQICYGMNTGFPAILTPQLRENCSEFPIDQAQQSILSKICSKILILFFILIGKGTECQKTKT